MDTAIVRDRIMGLDFGSKTVGVAVSDGLGLTAQGVEIIRRESENKLRRTLARIQELIEAYSVTKIDLGFPNTWTETKTKKKSKQPIPALGRRNGSC